MSDGMASDTPHQTRSPAIDNPSEGGQADEAVSHAIEAPDSVTVRMMERVVERDNLRRALDQVRRNKGGPGIDGLTVERLPDYLKRNWPTIRTQLLNGTYQPAPVKRVLIPKPDGGVRSLGVPTVVDRFIQQAFLQVLQREWDQTFSPSSFGFRPKRSAHEAVAQAQTYVRAGYRFVVDMDLEKFFDNVNHDVLMHKVKQRVKDDRVVLSMEAVGRAGYRRLRALGIDRQLAWNTAKSAHGPWRLSKSPALNYAMDSAYFTHLGLPTLARS